ncbi:MAG: hypothetical protein M0P12_01225 [Paludibacteraceae bacterium]|nr:hypothetical protein [Paludibacteraceae bacterium]
MKIKPFKYSDWESPEGYVCSKCGKQHVRLYRQYQTCADAVELLCRSCALKDQKQKVPDHEGEHSIGWLVAAVPTKDGETYWGFTSVPQDGVDWWNNLAKEGK